LVLCMRDKTHIMVKTICRERITLEVQRLDTINKVDCLSWLLYCYVGSNLILVRRLSRPVSVANLGSIPIGPVIYIEPIVSYDM